MRRVEFWRWMIPGNKGKLHRSRFDMTEEEAKAHYPGCQRVPGTCVVRNLPETEEEVLKMHTGSFLSPERFATSATPPPAPDAEPGSPPPPAPESQ
jgi:hypothetical protein